MTAIGWLLIVIGIAAIITGYHGKGIWSAVNDFLKGQGKSASASG